MRVSVGLHPIGVPQRCIARGIIGAMKLERIPVVLDMWVDCPRCGRRLKLQDALALKGLDAIPLILEAPYLCERCGSSRAFLVLKRQPCPMH
jgi:DNA-directed RNA polymerase subunit RPC12/RpoP